MVNAYVRYALQYTVIKDLDDQDPRWMTDTPHRHEEDAEEAYRRFKDKIGDSMTTVRLVRITTEILSTEDL